MNLNTTKNVTVDLSKPLKKRLVITNLVYKRFKEIGCFIVM
jgi:hypothetical protein